MRRAEREFGKPLWQLGTTTFGFDARGCVVCTWRAGDGVAARTARARRLAARDPPPVDEHRLA